MSDSPPPRAPLRAQEAAELLRELAAERDLLIIQDLDGVCMGLARDPMARRLDPGYIEACTRLRRHFFVLTNGEHCGTRGVNGIVDRALASAGAGRARYLPGLAAGGVQWQGPDGAVSHPGVSPAELAFLATLPDRFRRWLAAWLAGQGGLPEQQCDTVVDACVLDNRVSPTLNLNSAHHILADRPGAWQALQESCAALLAECLEDAARSGLAGSFFVHYAPNLGRGDSGEKLKPGAGDDAGTTDFQFMLSGAVKEAGVLDLINRWCAEHRGRAPLGEGFTARTAPTDMDGLVSLATEAFAPGEMPLIVGVGDTVSSAPGPHGRQRGGSDRGFLTLVKRLGAAAERGNLAFFVDSSGGEVRRPGVDWDRFDAGDRLGALAGITDPQDSLQLDVLFNGHEQYLDFFKRLSAARPEPHPPR